MTAKAPLTLRQLFRTRPQAVDVFEDVAGHRCWIHLDDTVSEFCRILDLDEDALMERVLDLGPTPEKQNWRTAALYTLIDNLTHQHQHFRALDLKDIQSIFSNPEHKSPAHEKILGPIQREFESFKQDFLWHMEEEESFLFPKIMRTEACVRHRELYPEIFKGSVNMYSSAQLHSPEETFKHMAESLIQRAQSLKNDEPTDTSLNEIIRTLKTFQSKLMVHTGLETEILFPRAIQLEDQLKKRMTDSEPQSYSFS